MRKFRLEKRTFGHKFPDTFTHITESQGKVWGKKKKKKNLTKTNKQTNKQANKKS